MKKLYSLVAAFFATTTILCAQSVVLINTDWSDVSPALPVATNGDGTTNYSVTGGSFLFKTCKYNDTNNPTIGSTVMNPANDNTVRYMRIGSAFTGDANGFPTNQFYQFTPTNAFVDGGKVTLTISVNGTGKGINVYNMTDKVLLGTIDISAVPIYTYADVTFTLPSTITGNKAIGFTRAEISGASGGVTFFTWKVKFETYEATPTNVKNVNLGKVISTDFYSLTGAKVATKYADLNAGMYIQKSTYENGQVITTKVLKSKK